MHRPKEFWTGYAKYIHLTSIILLDLKVNKLLILYGKDKTDLDILDFSLIGFQQENETKKCKFKKKTSHWNDISVLNYYEFLCLSSMSSLP